MPFLKVKHSHESVLSLCKLTWHFIYLTLSASTVGFFFICRFEVHYKCTSARM